MIDTITLDDIEQFADSLPPRKSGGTPNNSHCCAVAKIIIARGGTKPVVTYGSANYVSDGWVRYLDIDAKASRFIRLFDCLKKKRASKADIKSIITRVRNEFRNASVAVAE